MRRCIKSYPVNVVTCTHTTINRAYDLFGSIHTDIYNLWRGPDALDPMVQVKQVHPTIYEMRDTPGYSAHFAAIW